MLFQTLVFSPLRLPQFMSLSPHPLHILSPGFVASVGKTEESVLPPFLWEPQNSALESKVSSVNQVPGAHLASLPSLQCFNPQRASSRHRALPSSRGHVLFSCSLFKKWGCFKGCSRVRSSSKGADLLLVETYWKGPHWLIALLHRCNSLLWKDLPN